MNATMQRRIENSQLALIRMSAPKLQLEPQFKPVRPPMLRATATIAECLAAKGQQKVMVN